MRQDISGWQTRLSDQLIEEYVANGAWKNTTIAQRAVAKALSTPEKIAVYAHQGEDLTYGKALEQAYRLVHVLQGMGLQAGDCISMQLPNWIETIVIDIAAAAMGLVINPIIPIYRDAEVSFILGDAGAKVVFIPEQIRSINYVEMMDRLAPELPNLQQVVVVRPQTKQKPAFDKLLAAAPTGKPSLAKVDPNAVKFLMYTSGTTGRPKGVLHTHNSMQRVIDVTTGYWGLGENDLMFMPSPVTHITGYLCGVELPFCSEVRTLLMDRWNATEAVESINSYGATVTVSATPFLQELVDQAEAKGTGLPTLKKFCCGGAAVPPDLIHRAKRVFDNCMAFRAYGSTEAPLTTQGFIEPEEQELAAETDGKIHAYEVRVIDNDGNYLPQGEEGEIVSKGPSSMVGYGDPEQCASAYDDNGFFLTGDRGYITPEHGIVITGRIKDLIIRGGENLSAKEIEDVLHQHPQIHESAVVSMPHERLGEGVCAYLVLEQGAKNISREEIVEFLTGKGLARQKAPDKLVVIDVLPRTASGKIRKDLLREKIRQEIGV